MVMKIVDVSSHQGSIDWQKVKNSGVEGTIIRAGFGKEKSQVDRKFVENIEGAKSVGLCIGIYWFSYATTVEEAKQEALTCIDTIEPYRDDVSLPVYFDWEGDSWRYAEKHGVNPNKELISSMAYEFLTTIEGAGYWGGNYMNLDYYRNYYTQECVKRFTLWLADYNGDSDFPCDMQQVTSIGKVDGIDGNVDVNFLTRDLLSEIRSKSSETSCQPVSEPTKKNVYYSAYTTHWLPEVINYNERCSNGYAGDNTPICAIKVHVSNGSISARVHTINGKWLPWVTDCDQSQGGYAGIYTRHIDGLQLNPNSGIDNIEYRVKTNISYDYLPWVRNYNDYNSDGYAGVFGQSIIAIQIRLI